MSAAQPLDLSVLPADFRWGVATSAFQVEGAPDVDGRLPSIWDDFCRAPSAIADGDTGAQACDSYRRWPDDLALLRALGVDSYRFSLAWPRIQPTGTGPANETGLDHYDRMVDDLLAAGIRPFVTLYHWDLPSALQRVGGWVSRETAHRFADYAALAADRLGDRVVDWTTVNEPACSAWIGHLEGKMAPGHRDVREAVHAAHHLLLGHGLAAQAMRSAAVREPALGIVLNLSPCDPGSDDPADVRAAERADGYANRWWLDALHGRGYPADMVELFGVDPPVLAGDAALVATPLDLLGINYYFRMRVVADDTVATLGYRQVPVDGAATTSMGWEIHPQGLRDVLVRVAKEYDSPRLYVTESGAAFNDEPDATGYVHDHQRADYVRTHVQAMAAAVADGAPVHGYYAWSLIDNFEWAYGYRPRFGLAYVDYRTQRRTLKHSGEVYARLIAGAAG
jgi:beta-glucosidase